MCALRLSHSGALRTQWVDMSRVTLLIIIIIIMEKGQTEAPTGSYAQIPDSMTLTCHAKLP